MAEQDDLGLAAIGLRSADLDRLVSFYTEAMPGSVTRRREEPDRRAWVKVLGVPLEVAEIPAWTAFDENQRRSLPAISFNVRADQVDELVGRLEASGVPHFGPVLKMQGNGVSVYFGDPDGVPLSYSCSGGYPIEGLSRNAALWAAAPYEWKGSAR